MIGLPLLIHLLHRACPKVFEFSSVQSLRESIVQSSRLFRLRHLLLVFLRTLFLSALLVAFLRPILPRFGLGALGPPVTSGRVVLLVLDHSLSMEYQATGLSARQRAKTEAAKIMATLGPDDVVNAMVVDATPSLCQVEFSHRHAEVAGFVQAVPQGLGSANFTEANRLIARLLTQVDARMEIYYLSDFQRRSWAKVDFRLLPPQARVFFVDAGSGSRGNRAVLGATINQSRVLAADTVTLDVDVGNFRDEPMSEPLKVLLDGRVRIEKEVRIAPWSVGKVTVLLPAGAPGLRLCEISLAPDALPQDDRFFLTIPVVEKEAVLIVSDGGDSQKDTLRTLRTALNPYEHLAGSLLPEEVDAAHLSAAKLAAVRKVFFTRCGPLSAETGKALAEFMFHGGGMVYFLDGDGDAKNLDLIEGAMAGDRMPLKLGVKRVAGNLANASQQIGRGDFSSRFLRLFRGGQRQNLSLLEFYDIDDASPTGAGKVLLHYADETPALASLNHGLGTLLLLNFSVSELSSNLARQRIFPAWIQDIVKNLTSDEAVSGATRVGDLLEDEVWKSDLSKAPFLKPSGQTLELKGEELGERVAISFRAAELGFYTQRAPGLLHAYGVNAPPEESDLRAIDRALLPQQLDANGQKGFFVEGRVDYHDVASGQALSHWFIVGALVLLVLEMAWLCLLPRHARGRRR